MAFKEEWSFLDKITMGSVGTEKVIRLMNATGNHIFELKRYCTREPLIKSRLTAWHAIRVGKMLDNTSSIICAFALAAVTPQPPICIPDLIRASLAIKYGQQKCFSAESIVSNHAIAKIEKTFIKSSHTVF